MSVSSATGGNFENLVVSGGAGSVTTTINDEASPDTVLVSLAGPAAVTEGAATGNFTVTLGQAAVTAVTAPVRPRQISGAKMPGTHEPSPPLPASAMKSQPFDQSKPRGLSRPVATTSPAESSTVLPKLLTCAVLRPAPAKEPPINKITKAAAYI